MFHPVHQSKTSKEDSSSKKRSDKPKVNYSEMADGHEIALDLGAQPAQMMVKEEEEKPKQGKMAQMKEEGKAEKDKEESGLPNNKIEGFSQKSNTISDKVGYDYFINSIWYINEISKLDFESEEGIAEMIRLAEKASSLGLTEEQATYLQDKGALYKPNKAGEKRIVSGFRGISVRGYNKDGKIITLYDGLTRTQPKIPAPTINYEPKWYSGYGGMEGHSDGGLGGTSSQSKKDVVVGLGVVGSITGVGALIEAGTISVLGVLSLLNNLDDALGGFTNGDGSLSQDLSPEDFKKITTSLKATTSFISAGVNSGQIIKNKDYDKAMKVLSTISDAIGAASNSQTGKHESKN